jgi:hypothetical protein
MKVYAPYRKFKYGTISFSEQSKDCSAAEVKMIKTIPLSVGEFKDSKGNLLNKSAPIKKVKKSAKKSKK